MGTRAYALAHALDPSCPTDLPAFAQGCYSVLLSSLCLGFCFVARGLHDFIRKPIASPCSCLSKIHFRTKKAQIAAFSGSQPFCFLGEVSGLRLHFLAVLWRLVPQGQGRTKRGVAPGWRDEPRPMRAVCVLVVAVALLPARSTWAGETTAGDVSEPTTRVVTVGELTRALQGAGGAAGAGGEALRRRLLDVVQDAPRLHVLPQRRSLDPQQPLRLEVEDTGQAVSVTRAHLYRQRQHAAGQAAAPARGSQALRALHELERKSPTQLGSCTANATRKITTNWKNQNYNLVSHGIVFGATTLSTGKTEVIAVVMRDPDMYKLEQWKNDQDDRNTAQISIDQNRIGFSIVKFDYQLGAACSSCWTSGVGAIGFQDGRKDAAIFSDRITSLAWSDLITPHLTRLPRT